jgi:hypothetical protein
LKLSTSIPKEDQEEAEVSSFYRDHCLKVYEAWEEGGHLFIKSELCEKGNLNDYLAEYSNMLSAGSEQREWWQIVSEE